MGTGPYKILSWQPESRIAMAVNEDWWDKHTGNVEQVLYTPIKSDSTRVSALLSGDVDMVTDVPTQDIDKLRADKRLKVVDGPEVRTIFIALDQGSKELKYSNVKGKNPFKDKRVREALNRGRRPRGDQAQHHARPVGAGRHHGRARRQRLQHRARQAAEGRPREGQEAARRGRLPARLRVPAQLPEQPLRQRREDLPWRWCRCGPRSASRCKLIAESMATFIQKFQNFDSSLYMLGWGVATYDAQYSLQSLVRTRTSGADGNFNFSKVSDAKVDQLIDAMKTETDVAKRNAHDPRRAGAHARRSSCSCRCTTRSARGR